MKRQLLSGLPLVALLGGLLAMAGGCSGGDCISPGEDAGAGRPGEDNGKNPPVVITVASRSTAGGNFETMTNFQDGTAVGIVTADGVNHEYAFEDGMLIARGEKKIVFEVNETSLSVEAFYPYVPGGYGRLTVKADQNTTTGDESNYYLSDVLHAAGSTTKTVNDLQLTFHHVMSKLLFNVNMEEGRAGITSLAVHDQPLSAAFAFNEDGSPGAVSNVSGESTSINACVTDRTAWRAIIIPRDNVPLTVTAVLSDKTYTATLPSNNFEPGKQYTYNITVKNGKLQVTITGNGVEWQDELAATTPLVPATFKVTLAGNYPSSLTLTNLTTTKEPNVYKTVSGNTFSISYTIPEGEDNKRFYITKGVGKLKMTTNNSNYLFNGRGIGSDLWLEYKEFVPVKVGDYYYNDGTWSSEYVKDAWTPCVGIVFKLGPGNGDNAVNYGDKLDDNTIHGYVVALTDAHAEAGAWGIRGTTESIPEEDGFVDTYNGYVNTLVIRRLDKYATTNVANPWADNQYWAFRVASDYNVSLPASTSGWYLPSIGQLKDIYDANLNDRFTAAGGTAFSSEDDGRYWSATQKNNMDAWYFRFKNGTPDAYAKSPFRQWFDPSRARAVFTF